MGIKVSVVFLLVVAEIVTTAQAIGENTSLALVLIAAITALAPVLTVIFSHLRLASDARRTAERAAFEAARAEAAAKVESNKIHDLVNSQHSELLAANALLEQRIVALGGQLPTMTGGVPGAHTPPAPVPAPAPEHGPRA